MIETKTPAGVATARVEANRFGRNDAWPKRNSVLLMPDGELYRVAKVGSRNESYPYIWLVPAHAEPIEGKDGSASVHYPSGSGYYQTDVARLAKDGVRIILRDSAAAEEFIEASVTRQIEADRQAEADRVAYAKSPAGGVADRIEDRAKNLQWRAKDMRSGAVTLEHYAKDLRVEVGRLPDEQDRELMASIMVLDTEAEFLRKGAAKVDEEIGRLESLVATLRGTDE